MRDSDLVTVCDNCFRAACWHGDFMCENASNAGTIQIAIKRLRTLNLEHPDFWDTTFSFYSI